MWTRLTKLVPLEALRDYPRFHCLWSVNIDKLDASFHELAVKVLARSDFLATALNFSIKFTFPSSWDKTTH